MNKNAAEEEIFRKLALINGRTCFFENALL